jgi:hypothetical protein
MLMGNTKSCSSLFVMNQQGGENQVILSLPIQVSECVFPKLLDGLSADLMDV